MSTAIRTIQMPGARAAAADTRTSGDYLARAVALHLAGKRQEALDHLDRAVASNQGSPEIYRAMGHILFEMGDYAAAAKTYRLLVQAKPQYGLGWLNLAVCLERINDWEGASQSFYKASTLDPKNAEAHLGLGVCHLRLEDAKSALYSFDRCLELSPGHEDAAFGKAAVPPVPWPRRRSRCHL